MEQADLRPVLDPCCGSRMFYFDRDDPRVLFCDVRQEEATLCDGRLTNYERYFGTPERAAESMANTNGFNKAFDEWADGDGALLCSITPTRGSRKAKKQAEVFEIWLQEECDD